MEIAKVQLTLRLIPHRSFYLTPRLDNRNFSNQVYRITRFLSNFFIIFMTSKNVNEIANTKKPKEMKN